MTRKSSAFSGAILQRIIYFLEALKTSKPGPPFGHAASSTPRNRAQYQEPDPVKSLRLVSKAFAKAATPAVFGCIAFFPLRNPQKADMHTLMDITNSGIAAYVQTMVIRPLLSSSVDDQWLQCTQFALALPICFEKFISLRTVSIDGSVFLGLDREVQYGNYTAPLLTPLRRSFVKALDTAFGSALLRNVTRLELDFPVLEGFLQSPQASNPVLPCSKTLSHLEHLAVTVRYHSMHAQYTATTSLPPQHQHYPALQYQGRFWTLINHATNLRSLRIHCTTVLDLSNLCLANLQRLEVLDLSRVRCRKDNLLAICSPTRSSLVSLRLYEIRLVDGIWTDVFLVLKTIPTLVEFEAMSLTYDTPPSHFARILQPLDPYLEMPRRDDRDAFQELTKSVQRRCVGDAALFGHWAKHSNNIPN